MQPGLVSHNFVKALAASVLCFSSSILAQDECNTAIPVFDGVSGPFDNSLATNSAPPFSCPGLAGNDLWFSCQATCTGTVTADTGPPTGTTFSIDTVIEAFSGTCGHLVSEGCNDDACAQQSRITFLTTAGVAYLIRGGGWQGATGNFPLRITRPDFQIVGGA